jgi:nucleoside-diphosphate-sugar epimerase
MRFVILGGTWFIGPAVVEELAGRHQAIVVTRGRHRGPELPAASERRCDRFDEPALARVLAEAAPDVIVDTCAYTRRAAEIIARARPPAARLVVLSSMDVYRAFGALLRGEHPDPNPLDEDAPLRAARHLYRGRPDAAAVGKQLPGVEGQLDDYEKLDVEPVVLAAGATVLRLAAVHGPRDPLRREEPILGRLRAGRTRIPFGAGTLLWTRVHVRDAARAVRLAGERDDLAGQVLNVGERRTLSVWQWGERVLAAAGGGAELVRVPDEKVPPELAHSRAYAQHVLVDSSRAMRKLGWEPMDPVAAVEDSVRWHLAHPPETTADYGGEG